MIVVDLLRVRHVDDPSPVVVRDLDDKSHDTIEGIEPSRKHEREWVVGIR